MKVLSRAPLVPIGSLMTCTRTSSPALTRRRMSSTGGALASGAPTTVSSAALPAMSAACRKDRKSTRLNSSHEWISYAVFCLKKKKKQNDRADGRPGEMLGALGCISKRAPARVGQQKDVVTGGDRGRSE